ncbi:hypothetical protein BST36_25390 [Mycolicibacterium moriokaense]|uniref:Acyltransferase n=1 Tax=Mycolicibacterium moriokaense TaxID=39691 RepID=A0AAD1HER2_9MYCO|nr:acyltransferase [Mycolicibacterium moriokaense]MCV7042526.1 acyltransferase [Mycolicibacterium moriokaense]ORB16991.1 hypothetical protein BST36_25390 [Mycolicibacterium moriokaense]BBX04060.1 acyltransferase [Mycolicibacterium moriokaense]
MPTLTTFAAVGRNNSIGFLRLVAASLVIVGHSIPFGGFGSSDPLMEWTHNQVATGRFPVDVFFILSGFLITASFERTADWRVYAWHRFLRIYPAFLVCIALTGLVVAPIFGSGVDLTYILVNAPLISGIIDVSPGLFTTNPYPSVNGALWTLPWELRAYLLLGVLGALGLFKRRWLIAAVFVVCWATFVVEIFSYPGLQTSAAVTSGMRLFTFFFAGALFYLYRESTPVKWQIFVASLVFILVGIILGTITPAYSGGVFYAVAPIPLSYATLYLGIRLNVTKVNSLNDRLYGIYIYGSLMLNIFVCLGLNRIFGDGPSFWNWLAYLVLTYIATYIVASLSWFAIEKPAMSFKNRPPWRRSGKSGPGIRPRESEVTKKLTGEAAQ